MLKLASIHQEVGERCGRASSESQKGKSLLLASRAVRDEISNTQWVVFCCLIGHWYTSLQLALGFVFLFHYIRQKFRWLSWDPSFLMEKFTAVSFSVSTALPASHMFCLIVCCVFIFIHLKIFPNLLMISSLTLWLFRSVLFNFHVFVNVPKFFLLLVSDSIVVRGHTLCHFCYFKWTEVCLMA